MTVFTWSITRLEGIEADAPFDLVLTRAYWKLTASQGDVSAEKTGYCKLTVVKDRDGVLVAPYIDADSYIKYDSVTEEDVVGWVQSSLGDEQVSVLERTVYSELESKLNTVLPPAPIDIPLPWIEE